MLVWWSGKGSSEKELSSDLFQQITSRIILLADAR